MSISSKLSKDKIPSLLGFRPMTVLTGSMSPQINPGDVIIDKRINTEDIRLGDIVTYRVNSTMLVTHRVVNVLNKDDKLTFETKGDANNSPDDKFVTEKQIIGKYIFRIPYAGYLSQFSRSIFGFIILVLIPTVLLIFNQIKMLAEDVIKNNIDD